MKNDLIKNSPIENVDLGVTVAMKAMQCFYRGKVLKPNLKYYMDIDDLLECSYGGIESCDLGDYHTFMKVEELEDYAEEYDEETESYLTYTVTTWFDFIEDEKGEFVLFRVCRYDNRDK